MSATYNSAAHIDSTTIVTRIEAAWLRALLEPLGLVLMPLDPSGEHPINLELWHVDSGQLESLGVQQQAWCEGAGAAGSALVASSAGGVLGASVGAWGGATTLGTLGMALGPVGAWLGACSGFALGGAWGALAGASTAAVSGGAWGAQLGKRWSEAASHSLGTYNETLLTVPNVRLAGGGEQAQRFVLAMCSDSAISIWGDRVLGCGYAKRLCAVSRDAFHSYEVREHDAARTLVLSARFEAASDWRNVNAELDAHRALHEQPLLGALGQRRFARTRLERALGEPATQIRAVRAQLSTTARLAPGLPALEIDAPPLSAALPWGAYQIRHLPVRLTDPEPVAGSG